MDNYDPQLAARVWARVRGEASGPDPEVLQRMAAAELEAGSVYLWLSGSFAGQRRELLRQIYSRKQRQVAYLRGMYRMITGRRLSLRLSAPVPGAPEPALKACYRNALRAMEEWEPLTRDREYGCVFARMLQQEQEHCALLLEILGSLGQQERPSP